MPKQVPQRTCLGGGGVHAKAALWRFVAADETVWFDIAHKAPGRGAYVFPKAEFLAAALKRKAFQRKLNATPPADLTQHVLTALEQRLVQLLGLELKAGRLATGVSKVLEQADAKLDTVLARDAGADATAKFERWNSWRVLDKAALETLTGQPNCTVVAWPKRQVITDLLTQIKELQNKL